jgi:hypothetical protein
MGRGREGVGRGAKGRGRVVLHMANKSEKCSKVKNVLVMGRVVVGRVDWSRCSRSWRTRWDHWKTRWSLQRNRFWRRR